MDKLTAEQIAFIEWISINDEWHFKEGIADNYWYLDGYKSRTTQELFEYYLIHLYKMKK